MEQNSDRIDQIMCKTLKNTKMGICVLTFPQCNFETDFPEIPGQIHIAFIVRASFGTQKTMHCGVFPIGRQGTLMELVMSWHWLVGHFFMSVVVYGMPSLISLEQPDVLVRVGENSSTLNTSSPPLGTTGYLSVVWWALTEVNQNNRVFCQTHRLETRISYSL